MHATFLDCYPLANEIIVWLWVDGKMQRFTDTFYPKVYAHCGFILNLQQTLASFKINSILKRKKLFTGGGIQVLEISVYDISSLRALIRDIEREKGYDVDLFNADIAPEQYYLFEKGLFPFCEAEFYHDCSQRGRDYSSSGQSSSGDSGRSQSSSQSDSLLAIRNIDSDAYDYPIPEFRIAELDAEAEEPLERNFEAGLTKIIFNGAVISGTEKEILERFKAAYLSFDPDIVLAGGGNVILPYLRHKFSYHRIEFSFSRVDPDSIAERREGSSYFSYGRVLYREHAAFLRGRFHIDKTGFMHREGGLHGVIELARTCRMPLQKMSHLSPGSGIHNLQCYQAFKEGYLIPYKKNLVEKFKPASQLFEADRGGIIYEPITGFHENVAELDFSSMYPSIMVKHNISPETILCGCCDGGNQNQKNIVPGINYHICTKRVGIVPKVLEPIIKRRLYYKTKKDPVSKARKDILKWILVCSFGYMGFRKSKFARIEAHEAINAFARDKLLKASRILEERGFQIVHGIIDSLYAKRQDAESGIGITPEELQGICREIEGAVQIPIAIEGVYRWIVFLPSVADKRVPVPTRFYGLFNDGTLKMRGIEMRKSDTPLIVYRMQEEMLEALKTAGGKKEFMEKIPALIGILKKYTARLGGAIKPGAMAKDLAIIRKISKLDYRSAIPQKIISEKLLARGFRLRPGNDITYIIKNMRSRLREGKFTTLEDFNGIFDRQKYRELLIKAALVFLGILGYDEPDLENLARGEGQLRLFEALA